MTEHKHAEVFRAIADGVPIDEFEARRIPPNKEFVPLTLWAVDVLRWPAQWEVRRKQQYIVVNGFKVPKPLDVMPEYGDFFYPALVKNHFYDVSDVASDWAIRCFKRGISHATKEAAIAHAKAMLGIDPEA